MKMSEMVASRAAMKAAQKAEKAARNAPKTTGKTFQGSTDTTQDIDITMPEDHNEKIVYFLLHGLSLEQKANGYYARNKRTKELDTTKTHSHVVPTFMIQADLKAAGESLDEPLWDVLRRLESQGFIKVCGGRAWIPTCFDTGVVRGARGAKGTRGAELKRQLDALLNGPRDFHAEVDEDEDTEAVG